MKSPLVGLLCVVVVCWLPAQAGTILYTDNGTFSAATSSSAFSGPSESWAFSFEANRNPTVISYGNGGFDFAFSNFSYDLNGSAVAITPTFLRFFAGHNGGGLMICFNGTTVPNCTEGLISPFNWPQLYTGPNSAPTMLTGAFTGDLGVIASPNGGDAGVSTLVATAVPEPSTLMTLAAGLLASGGGLRLYRRR
jgi:PEP-CTERM motif-containing protein